MKRILTSVAVVAFGTFMYGASAAPHWITTEDNRNEPNSWLCFQKEISVDTCGAEVPVRVACDSKYWMWVNGRPVVIEGGVKRGPNPADTYYDEVDLAPYLASGDNLVSVLVWHFGKSGFSHNSSGSAALFIDGGSALPQICTDGTWVGRLHPAYYTPSGEVPNYRLPESNIGFDARRDMPEWESEYHPRWSNTVDVGNEGDAPWGRLHHRVIPQWKDYGLRDYTATEVRKGNGYDTLVAVLPYNAQVMPYMELDATSGMDVTIKTDHYDGGSALNVRSEYVARLGNQRYETKGWMNGHRVYYIYPSGAEIRKVQFRETGYDADFAGTFSCDDEFMNTLWQKALRTLYITMRDTYMDCPDRERAQWWGDEVNESGEAFYVLSPSSHKLMKKGMYELIGWQRPDSTLHSPVPGSYDRELPGQMLASVGRYGFWNYYLNTGDIQPIADLYDGVERYLQIWKREPDGTVAPRSGGWHWGDWGTDIDKTALYNAWYYMALDGQRLMADALGRKADADSIAQEMSTLKEAFNRVFWNGSAYRTPDYKKETDDRVQALAVVAGLADADKYDALLEVFRNHEHASPYMEKYVDEALFLMGHGEYGLERMKRRFMPMVSKEGYSTLFEGWGLGAEGFGGGTANHAWSGGGLTILSQYVCGIEPVEPGFSRWKIAPQPAGIGRADISVPTVKGEIKAGFVDGEEEFVLTVHVPEGTVADVRLPYKGLLMADGKNVGADKPEVTGVLPGSHEFRQKKY